MRVLLQRVLEANVTIDNEKVAAIANGLLVLLGIEEDDSLEDIEWLCKKITNMRIFNDQEGKMNVSLLDVGGEVLVVSQFTLYASTKKGNRPSFIRSAKPEFAIPLYQKFITELEVLMPGMVQTGTFGADMKVGLINDGPVTIWLDSKNRE